MATDLIGQLLFLSKDEPSKRVEFNVAMPYFVVSLRTYCLKESIIEDDCKVRESWNAIKKMLQDVVRPNGWPEDC